MHNHNQKHSHSHAHFHKVNSSLKLLLTILLNILITVSEIIGGLISGSLALLSDAFHNLSDVFSLIISYIALNISKKEKNKIKTFGYKRAEVLAALFNIIILLIAVIYILQEAIKRFFNPQPIAAPVMITITIIGLIGNSLSILIIFKDAKKNINIKSAFLHLLGDTISSVGVLVVAIILFFFPGLFILDPIVSILIIVYIVKEGFSIFMESVNILMQGIPEGIDPEKIIKRLRNEKELNITDIHHLHIWGLSPEEVILDCHIVVPDKSLNKINDKLTVINHILSCEFNICHSTIQFESEGYEHSIECEL